jgi:translation initiation factor 2 beta subunit (eIF-2beta)/eIF-5
MLKSKVIIGALLITNAFAGVMWWRSQQQVRQLSNEARTSSKQHEIALKENHSLQEAIFREKAPNLKLAALNNTTLGKCVSEHPEDAQEYCDGPEHVIKSYQKILNRPKSKVGIGTVLINDQKNYYPITNELDFQRLIQSREYTHKLKMQEICNGKEGAEISTQCELYKGSQNE